MREYSIVRLNIAIQIHGTMYEANRLLPKASVLRHQDFRQTADRCKEIYLMYFIVIEGGEKTQRILTCHQLDWKVLGY